MNNTIQFEIITDILSEELFESRYIIGKIDETHFVYIWTQLAGEEEIEITTEMLKSPKYNHGAMIGTVEEIRWEVKNCVGQHRLSNDKMTASAANEVVEELLNALI